MTRFRARLLLCLLCLTVVAAPTSGVAAGGCPKALIFEADDNASRVDLGWRGLFHDRAIAGWSLRMKLGACAGSTAGSCGECPVTGLVSNAGGRNQRCTDDTSVRCTSDDDCTAPGTCAFFAAPPFGWAGGGVFECAVTRVPASLSGTVDVESGALSLELPIQSSLYFPENGFTRPCPVCEGDGSTDDDVSDGTCNGGPRHGLACDANAASKNGVDFTSLDCPPDLAKFVGALTSTTTNLTTGTTSVTLSNENPACFGAGPSRRCFCDTCNNANADACSTNADCPPSGGNAGVCGGRRCLGGANAGTPCTQNSACGPGAFCGRWGEPTRPNACIDDTETPEDESLCTDVDPSAGEDGRCVGGPGHSTCAFPEDDLDCLADSDCPVTHSCSAFEFFRCFLDGGVVGGSVSVSGEATPPSANVSEPTSLGALYCSPISFSSAINAVTGLPGLTRLKLHGALTFADEVVIESAAASAVVTTDSDGDAGATADDATETAVTPATGGEVTVVENDPTGTPPVGGTIVGDQVEVKAPVASAANPLKLVFDVDGSAAPGLGADDLALRRDGAVVPPCTSVPPQPISPDPCVFERATAGDDLRIGSYSSSGSTWDVVAFGLVATTATPTPGDAATATPTATATPVPTATVTPEALCPAVPAPCRTPAVAAKAQVSLVDKAKDKDDQLQWKWLKGAATTKAEFGNPLAGDGYALCLYDANGLVATLAAPAGGTCGKKPCWAVKKTGFTYNDPDRTPDGLAQIVLKEGASGKAQITVKGKGVALPMPSLATLASPLTVQLRRSGGACWGSVFSFPPAGKNDAAKFSDKAD